ncbi:competence pheromone ComX [Lysinibacillus xylanilyticus]|uniref:competence pheromone ComX n=1 Tax=Lysinibacillus xylanilyticus TaxID=582475 RepID=UPI00380B29C1
MIKLISLLEENPLLVNLLKENKLSLIGVTELEQQSIVAAFEEELCLVSRIWG